MNFKDFYTNGFNCSIEVFPPKTETGKENLIQELLKLKAMHPAFVSVTYGAMGSTRNVTSDLAIQIKNTIDIPTAFHFTCIGSGKEQIKEYVERLHKQGIDLIVALRGDKPKDPNFEFPADGFQYANELVSYLKGINNFSLAVAGYPEVHPEAPNMQTDIENLKRKVDSGADVIITQLFLQNDLFYDWLNKIRQAGIDVPVIPGIMPIKSIKTIQKIKEISNSSIPSEFEQHLIENQNDKEALMKIGLEQAVNQCQDLKDNGMPGIHFYCLNKSEMVLKVCESLK